MDKMKRSIFLSLLFWLTLGCCISAFGQQRVENNPCETALPSEARMIVDDKLKDWKGVAVADLRPDDQRICTAKFGSTCPGIARGHFSSTVSSSYAVTLIQKWGQDVHQILVVLSKTPHTYRITTLSPSTQTSVPSIVAKLPPGRYSDAEDSMHISSRLDVISYEAIEAGAEIYYWLNGRYHALQLQSDLLGRVAHTTRCSLCGAFENPDPRTSFDFGYDAAGNMTSDGAAAYTYDMERRVVQALVLIFADLTRTEGTPSFAHFAKGGNREVCKPALSDIGSVVSALVGGILQQVYSKYPLP